MRVAVVYFPDKRPSSKAEMISKALEEGIIRQGHTVELINGARQKEQRLTQCEYIAVGYEPVSFFSGKLSPRVNTFFKNAGEIAGTRSFAYIIKRGWGFNKSMKDLMEVMEHYGLFIRNFDALQTVKDAEYTGSELIISK